MKKLKNTRKCPALAINQVKKGGQRKFFAHLRLSVLLVLVPVQHVVAGRHKVAAVALELSLDVVRPLEVVGEGGGGEDHLVADVARVGAGGNLVLAWLEPNH